MSGDETASLGVRMFHYSLLFPQQVRDKAAYYREAPHARRVGIERWAAESYFALHRPFRVHNIWEYPSWLEWYAGEQPPAVADMWNDICAGRLEVETREMSDAWRLLSSRSYAAGRVALEFTEPMDRFLLTDVRRRWENLRFRLRGALTTRYREHS